MSFTALAKGRYLEALAIDERVVWFSDVILGGVQGLKPDGSLVHWLAERKWIGGLLFNEDGSLLCSGPGGIVWLDPATGRSGTLLSSIDGASDVAVHCVFMSSRCLKKSLVSASGRFVRTPCWLCPTLAFNTRRPPNSTVISGAVKVRSCALSRSSASAGTLEGVFW